MATYYWVGGNGTWDASTTTNWSLSSGGGGSAGFPTAADNVIFNSNSGAAPVVTVTSAVALDCTIGAPTSGTLTLAFGASTLTLAGNFTCSTTISVTGTGTITLSATGKTFAGNGNTFYNLSFTATGFAANATITGTNTFNSLTISSLASTNSIKTLLLGDNQTISGTFTLGTTNSPTKRVFIQSNTIGTQRTISVATMATLTDVDFSDIAITGTASPVSGTRLGNCLNNSGITFAAGVNKYLRAGVAAGIWNQGIWSLTSGNVSGSINNFPLAQDTVVLDDAGVLATSSLTLDYPWPIGSINGSVRTTAMTLVTSTVNYNIYANISLSSSITCTGTGTMTFSGQGLTQTVTTAGKTWTQPWVINNITGVVQLQDNATLGTTLTTTLTSGTLDLSSGNRTLSAGLFNSTNSNTRAILFGTGNITTTGSGTVWNTSSTTGFSYTGTPTVNISNNSATATTVSTGSMTAAQALNFNYTTGTYTLTDTAAVYKSVNFTGFSGTIPNSTRTLYGGLTFSAGMTLTAGANVTTFAATSGTNNITTALKTLDFPITFFGVGGTFAFQDALTQGSTRAFTFTAGTVQLKAATTNTVGSFVATNSTMKYLQSTTPGTQATISDASGTNTVSYLTIQDSIANGGATWLAYTDQGNIDAGNVDGWDFGISPVVGGAEYTYVLRSFTTPRRF